MKKTTKKAKRPEPLGMPDGARAEAWDRYAAAALIAVVRMGMSGEPAATAMFGLADSMLSARDERFR